MTFEQTDQLGLHGLHFLWFIFIYMIENQLVNIFYCYIVGLQCKP